MTNNLFDDEEQAALEAQFAYDPAKSAEALARLEQAMYHLHLAFFFQAVAMYASQEVIPFNVVMTEDKVNYLIADNVYQGWVQANQEGKS